MTLYRQLIIFTLLLFFILFMGTWFAKFESTRSFLINQLESHAQDTATSLGLAITQHVIKNDMPSVESMINAVFDRGYYQTIKFIDIKGKILTERNLDVVIEKVPPWFINLVPLIAPEANAYVMAGWRQAGTVYVKSHPGYAYDTLWQDSVRMTIWFVVCGIFVLIVGSFGLQVLLKPLVRVEQQADAICRKEYEIQESLPRTRELRRVVIAMNRMTNKVKEIFEEQVALAEGFRERAYNDPLTGLGNRRYFEGQIKARLDRRDSATRGILLLVQIHQLQQLNQQKGFQAGDELLQEVATVLQEITRPYPNCILARLTGGDFGIFLPDAPHWDAAPIASDVSNKLSQLAARQITASHNVAHVGVVTYDFSTTLGRLLSETDLALRIAQQTGPNAWNVRAITEETERLPTGQQQWKDTLEKALRERRISLDAQPVVKTLDRNYILHIEIFSRIIQENGKLVSAGVFLPFAERLGLVSLLDRIVLEEVMHLDRRQLRVDNVAVNISPTSLNDDSFKEWIYSALKSLPPSAPRITFELPEFGAIQHLALVKEFRDFVQGCGHAMALDHYGQSFSQLGYLQSLRPDYVKIDRAYMGELKDDASDSRFYVGSLCSVAHSIDIPVIAEGVETEHQCQILKELNIDAMQGYVIDRPKPIASYLKSA